MEIEKVSVFYAEDNELQMAFFPDVESADDFIISELLPEIPLNNIAMVINNKVFSIDTGILRNEIKI